MRILILLKLILWSGMSGAVTVSDLYQISVPVEDQSSVSRDQGISAALQQVLVKVSGSAGVLENTQIQQQIGQQPERFVKSFRYARDEVDDTVRLHVVFAGNLLDQMLRQASQPIWGKSRPLILSWIAVEDQQARLIVNQDTLVWQKVVERAMSERGLPLLWPGLDLQDELALPLEKLWGLFREDIERASERYQADAVLAGRLTPTLDKQWRYQGMLIHQQQMLPLAAVADSHEAALVDVADQIAVYFSARYAVKTDSAYLPEGHQLQIAGINSFDDYYQALQYLKSKVAINDVQVLQAHQHTLTLSLDLAAPWPQVWRLLELDKRLMVQPDTDQLIWQK